MNNSKIMKYKDIPRRKFTEKQMEMLEKFHYLNRKVNTNYCLDDKLIVLHQTLWDKICKFLY